MCNHTEYIMARGLSKLCPCHKKMVTRGCHFCQPNLILSKYFAGRRSSKKMHRETRK